MAQSVELLSGWQAEQLNRSQGEKRHKVLIRQRYAAAYQRKPYYEVYWGFGWLDYMIANDHTLNARIRQAHNVINGRQYWDNGQ